MSDLALPIRFYTIHFKDKTMLEINEEEYEFVKSCIEQKIYNIEIWDGLYNLHFTNYNKIVLTEITDPIMKAIERIQPPRLKEWIENKKVEREKAYPHKPAYTSQSHLQMFIDKGIEALWLTKPSW